MGTSRSVDLLVDAFERVAQAVPGLLTGLNTAQLAWYPGPFANSIGWLVWHMARVEDDHMAGIAESEQVWLTDGWVDRFALPYDSLDIGYGQTPDQAPRLAGHSSGAVGECRERRDPAPRTGGICPGPAERQKLIRPPTESRRANRRGRCVRDG